MREIKCVFSQWWARQNKKASANQQLALAHPPKINDWVPKASKAIGSPGLSKQLTTASLLASGFQDKGANWKDQQLYYFSEPTGIRYQGGRVVWPDGTLSADYYNLARTKQHCRDLARAIYPRQPPDPSGRSDGDVAGASDCDVAGAPEKDAHSFELGRDTPTPQQQSHPTGPPKARP